MTNLYLPQPPRTPDVQLSRWFNEIWKKLGIPNAVLGAFRFGNVDSNTQIEADGTLVFNGDATVWNDINIPADSLKPGSTAPTWGSFFVSGGIEGWRFSAASVDMLHGSGEILHDYKEGSNLSAHVHWMPTSTNTGVVRWGLEYVWVNNNTIAGSPTTIYAEEAGFGTAWTHQRVSFPAITGAGKFIGSAFVFRLFRDGTHVNDTYTDAAALIQIGIHYESDTVGSRTISAK